MIHSNIELDGYQFIRRNSHTFAGGVGIYVKSSISYNLKPTINIDLSSVENLWIETEINTKKNNCRRCLPPSCPNSGAN